MEKITLVVGASPNPARYSYQACLKLGQMGHPFIPLGVRAGIIAGKKIQDIRQKPDLPQIHTLSLYLSAEKQNQWQEYLFSLEPQRIIFNPGSENRFLEQKASTKQLEIIHGCTLVMLATGLF